MNFSILFVRPSISPQASLNIPIGSAILANGPPKTCTFAAVVIEPSIVPTLLARVSICCISICNSVAFLAIASIPFKPPLNVYLCASLNPLLTLSAYFSKDKPDFDASENIFPRCFPVSIGPTPNFSNKTLKSFAAPP